VVNHAPLTFDEPFWVLLAYQRTIKAEKLVDAGLDEIRRSQPLLSGLRCYSNEIGSRRSTGEEAATGCDQSTVQRLKRRCVCARNYSDDQEATHDVP
jgi:hypothetical protein